LKLEIENDWNEHSRTEKIILVIVFALVVRVVISLGADGFAYSPEYNSGVREWNQSCNHLSNRTGFLIYPNGYDAALLFGPTDVKQQDIVALEMQMKFQSS
jgi:hypothetical protein